MKKLTTLLLTAAMIFSIAACDSSNNNQTSKGANEPGTNKEQITGEITVSCYEDMMYNMYLHEAGKLFEKKYPGTKITFEGLSPMPEMNGGASAEAAGPAAPVGVLGEKDASKKSDYINKINTEIMSGKGPDLIMTDIIPYYKYADKGMLESLDKYIENDADFKKADYRENVLSASKYSGKQYVLPLGFNFNLFSYDTQFLDKEEQNILKNKKEYTLAELVDLAGNSFEKKENDLLKLFDIFGGQEFFNSLFNTSYDKYIDILNKKANFTDSSFSKMLSLSKEVVSKGYIKEIIAFDPEKDDLEAFRKSFMNTRYYYNFLSCYDIFRFFDSGTSEVMKGDDEVMEIGKPLSKTSAIGGLIKSESGKKPLEILMGVVMNSNSKNKQTAWEFIKFLAGEEMQQSLFLNGLPINIKAGEQAAKRQILNSYGNPNMDESTEELNQEQKEAYDNYLKLLDEMTNSLDDVIIKDSMLDQIVKTEVSAFFDGSKTSDEVAKNIQAKVELYLNE